MGAKRYWHVVGYRSTKQIFERKVPLGYFSQGKMADALRMLAARSGLDAEEILAACSNKNSKLHRDLLDIKANPKGKFSMCRGENPYFIAKVVKE